MMQFRPSLAAFTHRDLGNLSPRANRGLDRPYRVRTTAAPCPRGAGHGGPVNTEAQIRSALSALAVPAGASAAHSRPVRAAVVCDEPVLRHALVQGLAASGLVEPFPAATDFATPGQDEAEVVLAACHPVHRLGAVVDGLEGRPIVLLAHIETDEDVAAALEAGATAVLSRRASLTEIIDVLRAARHSHQIRPQPGGRPLTAGPAVIDLDEPAVALTPRERQIVQLIVDDYSVKQIATRLGIALPTAKNHVHHVMVKLRVATRLQLYTWARAHGFTPSEVGRRPAEVDDASDLA